MDYTPETNSLHLKMMVSKFGISEIPGGYFQVRDVSFREGSWWFLMIHGGVRKKKDCQ